MLNEKQIRIAAEVVAAQKPIGEIMQAEGYARESYYKWMHENREFQDLIKNLQDECKEAALSVIKAGSVKAANLLIKAIEDGKVSKTRIDAANSVLAKAGFVPELMYRSPNEPANHEQLTLDDIRKDLEKRRLEVVQGI